MSVHYETTKREFVKIQTDIPVRYKFLSRTISIDSSSIYEGITSKLSGSGLLLLGRVPSFSWIPGLLMQEILVGINLLLPAADEPIKALCAVNWVEKIQKGSDKCPLGLRFEEISKEHEDMLLKFVIKAQITH
ncbi:MAG: PilZ domain-containing protein [Planctomycetes bacterium]|nr:PilZ domain-containing protein [Planctomycetota bacterium]